MSQLGFLSDSRTSALVDLQGRILWYCPLRFDGPSVFAELIDDSAGGWHLAPVGPATTTRRYLGESLILVTRHEQSGAVVEVTDFCALGTPRGSHELGNDVPASLVRIVRATGGSGRIAMRMTPRFEYGLTVARVELRDKAARMVAGPLGLRLIADVPLNVADGGVESTFELRAGQSATFTLTAWDAVNGDEPPRSSAAALFQQTELGWSRWMEPHRRYDGVAVDVVRRSVLVLQGLTDARTGAVVAAATTSLPERMGGEWNWDYRFAWLRDLSFVMRALWIAACPDEPDRFLRFLAGALGELDGRLVPIVLGSDGRRDLAEHTLDHLDGYRSSRPVRVGNDAWRQRQLDVVGEVLDSAHLLRHNIPDMPDDVRHMLRGFAERAASEWQLLDAGMWEARDKERPYTSSKVMCWLALDRAISLGEIIGSDLPLERWARERDLIRDTVMREAWSERAGAFAGALGSDELDASVLLMPLVGFLPADDPRMKATIEAIRKKLTTGHLVHRWDGDTNGFLLCSFWLAECEAMAGEKDAARKRFEALAGLTNDLGLMAEMYDPIANEMLGNFPQAFSHVGLINAAWRLSPRVKQPS
ncbi:MAG: glycoside hydrolase family 15 protein [Candidatus Limnocylindrales bacterium]